MTDAGLSGAPDESRVDRRTLLRRGAGLTASAVAASWLAGCGGSSSGTTIPKTVTTEKPTVKPVVDGDLSFINFSGFMPDSVIKGFEKEYGVTVHQTFIESDQEYIDKLSAGISFDLVKTSPLYLPKALAGNLLQPYDPHDLKNFDQLLPYFQNPWWESGPYRWATIADWSPDGIMYLSDKVDASHLQNSWNDLWTTPEARGHISLVAEAGDDIGMALLKNGFDANSVVPSEVNKAGDSLLELKPWLVNLTDNFGPSMISGEVWMAGTWPTGVFDILSQMKNPDTVKVYVPKEGPLIGADSLSIARIAKSPGTALLFIDWFLRPDNNYTFATDLISKTGTRAGDEAFGKLVSKYPVFEYADDLAYSPNNWKQGKTGAGSAVWNQAWLRFEA
jgi:spermidine/putrescine transport system substrate-binding protein